MGQCARGVTSRAGGRFRRTWLVNLIPPNWVVGSTVAALSTGTRNPGAAL